MPTTAEVNAAAQNFIADTITADLKINGAPGTVVDRHGVETKNLELILLEAGLAPPVPFAAGLSPTNGRFTVEYAGLIYRAYPGALPFTTTSTFNPAQWRLVEGIANNQGRKLDLPIVVVLVGQSNALGGSGTTGGSGSYKNPNVFVWEQIVGPQTTTTGWKACGPNGPDWPFINAGNNLGYHFCDLEQRATGRTVLLIQAAQGGAPISEFKPGGGIFALLNASMAAARAAAVPGRSDGATLNSLGITGADYLLIHQGEANADYTGRGAGWRNEVRSVIASYKSATYGFVKPGAPVLIGELLHGGTSGGNPTDDRNADIEILNNSEPLIASVSSRDLQSDDNLHFTGEALVEFARRFHKRLGVFPKTTISFDTTDPNVVRLANDVVMIRGNGVAVNAGATVTVTLPVTMANTGYVPSLTLTASGSSTPYALRLANRTATSFDIVNSGGVNQTVSWSIIDRRAV